MTPFSVPVCDPGVRSYLLADDAPTKKAKEKIVRLNRFALNLHD